MITLFFFDMNSCLRNKGYQNSLIIKFICFQAFIIYQVVCSMINILSFQFSALAPEFLASPFYICQLLVLRSVQRHKETGSSN